MQFPETSESLPVPWVCRWVVPRGPKPHAHIQAGLRLKINGVHMSGMPALPFFAWRLAPSVGHLFRDLNLNQEPVDVVCFPG